MDTLTERLEKMSPLQRAVFALKETQARLDELERRRSEPIAVIGIACRFPGGVCDSESYWRLLCSGTSAIREIPPDRWDADAYYDPDPAAPGKMNTRWGGFLDGIDGFDNHFFGVSDREAERVDPQHRLLLELAWEAMEDAGLPPSQLRGSRTGVFVGLSHSEYGMMLSTDRSQTDAYVGTGTANCIAANRISFLFDLYGPSIALDTACSSSLVAVHLACQSLRNGETEMALAGGVNMILSPLATVNLTKAGFSAPDGRIRAFDAAAAGYVRGEGAGLVLLKPLSAAVQAGDPIQAVIRGSAVNQNGFSNGLTAPSRKAQERAIRDACRQAGVSPGCIQYVEAQGTGTHLGDAIEALALGNVLAEDRQPGTRCAIGSVKTNIGHLEAAAGIASLIKVSLALRHGMLPASLNFEQPNPEIPFEQLPLAVQSSFGPWPGDSRPRLAGVSAFGFGGSNAHVVLGESPEQHAAKGAEPAREAGTAGRTGPAGESGLLPISARTEAALRALAERYVELLRKDPPAWKDVCYTATARRDHHDCRAAVVASSCSEAAELLESFLAGRTSDRVAAGRKPYVRSLNALLTEELQAAIDGLRRRGWDAYLPIGCGEAAAEAVRPTPAAGPPVAADAPQVPPSEVTESALRTVATLYALGADFRWDRLAAPGGRYVRIPTYPWQRQRRWVGHAPWLSPRPPAGQELPAAGTGADAAGDASASAVTSRSTQSQVQPAGSPVRTRPELNAPCVAPRTPLEASMARSWCEILRIDRVGIHDDFFELGGDSLEATMLLNVLREHLDEEIQTHVLFRVHTIADLASLIRREHPQGVLRLFPDEPLQWTEGDEASASQGSDREGPSMAKPEGAERSVEQLATVAAMSAAPPIPRRARDQRAEELLGRVDELSDEEVEQLLRSGVGDDE